MQLRTLDQNLQLRPFRAEMGKTAIGESMIWGCPYRPGIIYLDPTNPPTVIDRRPDPKHPQRITGVVENATVAAPDRNRVILSAAPEAPSPDMFLAVRLSLPHGLRDVRPIEVYTPEGLNSQRLYCDHGQSWKLKDGRSVLNLWSFLIIMAGDRVRLLHILPYSADLLEVVVANRDGHLSIKRRMLRKDAVPLLPSAGGGQPESSSSPA